MPYPSPGAFPSPSLFPSSGAQQTTVPSGGLYFGQTYFGGNGLVPTVLPPLPPPKPQVVRIVRELPPTRQVMICVATPREKLLLPLGDRRGRPVRTSPSGVRNNSTAPGGYEQFDAVLPRNPNVLYSDLEPMSTIRAEGVDGSLIGEYRLEATPDTSGDQMSISPSAVRLAERAQRPPTRSRC